MNFSIVLPGGCDAQCRFCKWEQVDAIADYVNELRAKLTAWPEPGTETNIEPCALYICGGEPTMSPVLGDVLPLIREFKHKFTRVFLVTNGTLLMRFVSTLEGIVDCVVINRYHFNKNINDQIFEANMIDDATLKMISRRLNMVGILVVMNAVMTEHIATQEDVYNMIYYAKSIGASNLILSKELAEGCDTTESELEKSFADFKVFDEQWIPALRSKTQLIDGIPVVWEAEAYDATTVMEAVYELILHPNMRLSSDWAGEQGFNLRDNVIIKLVKKKKKKDRDQQGDVADIPDAPPPPAPPEPKPIDSFHTEIARLLSRRNAANNAPAPQNRRRGLWPFAKND